MLPKLNQAALELNEPVKATTINVSVPKARELIKPKKQLMKHVAKDAENKEKAANSMSTSLVKNLENATGTSLQDTIRGLEAMSNAIIENPDLLDEAEMADAMLIEAIKAKLEIIDLL